MNEPKETFVLIQVIWTAAFFVLFVEQEDVNSLLDCFFYYQNHGVLKGPVGIVRKKFSDQFGRYGVTA